MTTYPRSDCEFLPENQFGDAKEILENLKTFPHLAEFVKNADISIKSRAWNDKKISAHHAIIPTRVKAEFENLNEIEKNLYETVEVPQFVKQFLTIK